MIEAVRAEKSVQMKSVLAELNMEQFRRVPLYESYIPTSTMDLREQILTVPDFWQ